MEKITRQTLAQDVPRRWREQYAHIFRQQPDKEEIARQLNTLEKLPSPVDPDTVDAIIGNKSWTTQRCNECESYDKPFVIMLGEPQDYESHTAYICGGCLAQAMNLAAE